MNKVLVILLLLLGNIYVSGQESRVLTFDKYMDMVKQYHPVIYQANLLSDMADGQERMARGGFDPKIEADWNHKSFDDKNYYSIASGLVKLPTWYGMELKAGYDRNSGDFLNDDEFIPTRGLWNAGISVPLGRGLVIDERRAELKRAKVYREANAQEQVLMINDLLFNAADAYLEWQVAQSYLDIATEGEELASTRLTGMISSFNNGDKPAIDTLESFISLQTRQLDLQKAQQVAENARLGLNNFLWIEGEVPLELAPKTIPEELDLTLLDTETSRLSLTQDQFLAAHPELLLYDYKVDNLQLDIRLAKEDLKPDLRVNYNPLIGVAEDALFDQFSANNYKLGASLTYPIIQRKERGKLQLTRLKMQDTEYNQTMKRQELKVKLDTYINNIIQTNTQYTLLNQTVENYSRMLVAENRKLSIGESSIFLVNSREVKYLDSKYKQVEAGRKLIYNRLTYLLYLVQLEEVI